MKHQSKVSRILTWIVNDRALGLPSQIHEATQGDLNDCLSEFEIQLVEHDQESASLMSGFLQSEGDRLVLSDAIAGVNPMMIESLIEPMAEEFEVVLGPTSPEGFYGLALSVALRDDVASELAGWILGERTLNQVSTCLSESGYSFFIQLPWFSIGNPSGREFAWQYMRSLEQSMDPEFIAHRALQAFSLERRQTGEKE